MKCNRTIDFKNLQLDKADGHLRPALGKGRHLLYGDMQARKHLDP